MFVLRTIFLLVLALLNLNLVVDLVRPCWGDTQDWISNIEFGFYLFSVKLKKMEVLSIWEFRVILPIARGQLCSAQFFDIPDQTVQDYGIIHLWPRVS